MNKGSRIIRLLWVCVLMTAMLCVFHTAVPQTANADAVYNAAAAVQYAVAHWNESGLCDAFVKDCLRAGGINISSSGVAYVYNELQNYGQSYPVVFAANNWLADCYASDNSGHIEPGDIIFYYCNACGCWAHTAIVTRIEDNGGKVHFCSHNNCAYDAYFNQSYSDEHGHVYPNISHYVIHLNSGNADLVNPLVFNAEYYRNANSGDLSSMSDSQLRDHWITYGIAEGRCASPVFYAPYYAAYGDLNYGTDYRKAIWHFVHHGISEGRRACEGFDVGIYKANYLDLQEAFGSDNYQYYLHFVNFGQNENRLATARFKLIFDANGGTCTISQKEITKLAAYGALPGENETTRAGYIFKGWFTDPFGGTEITASTQHLSDNVTTTVYAHWEELVLGENWTELSVLPADLDLTGCDIEYNSHYVTTGRTSPGSDWVLYSQGAVQYEAVGNIYESDSELPVSDTRRKVGQYYYHWCGSTMNLANYYQKSNLPTYHSIPMSEAGNYTLGSLGDDEGHLNSALYNSDGSLHYCPTGKSAGWYIKFVYQDYQAYQINTYTKDSGWAAQAEPGAASVTFRVRRKAVSAIDFENYAIFVPRGDTFSPALTILPETAGRANLTWAVSDPSIAAVDEIGTVTALRCGSAILTASSPDGSITDTLTVNVCSNVGAGSTFIVDGASIGFFTNDYDVEGAGVNSGAQSEYSRESLACIVREPGDTLSCDTSLSFMNDYSDCIVTYEVSEGNLVSAGSDTFVVSKKTARKNVITAHIYDVNSDGTQGAEMVTANMVVFVVNNDGTLQLPAGLQRLEANALDGTAATIIRLPDHVTLEDSSLAGIPMGSVIYFNSDSITPFLDRNVLGIEVDRSPDYFWIDTGTPTMAYFNGDGCATNYFCLLSAK